MPHTVCTDFLSFVLSFSTTHKHFFFQHHPVLDTTMATTITAASILLNSPHIVDMIVSHATRPDLVSYMRVSQLHAAAGRLLYHTVRVIKGNLASFFRGALVSTGVSEESQCKRAAEAADNDQPRAHRNFKAPLLAHTRVLSLGSHHTCVCDLYGPHAASLLRNLDTLRIVPTSVSRRKLEPLCDYEAICALFHHLTPRKLVLRNIDGTMWHRYSWPLGDWNAARLQEVVWVLPSNGRVYPDGELMDSGERFATPGVTRVKVIFHNGWEVWPAGERQRRLTKHASTLVIPEDVVYPLAEICKRTDIHTTVYGLETFTFHAGDSEMAEDFEERFPGEPLDNELLRELVRAELRVGAARDLIETDEYDGDDEDEEEEDDDDEDEDEGNDNEDEDNDNDDDDDDGCNDDFFLKDIEEHIEYHTAAEYAALPEHERLYELHDGLVQHSAA
ncbi:uncharacterized protein LOC62_01G001631 [Vanrija pseudolonga]|uniref:Uncharacterized protein n=1 Tax=Vanrija pseudolonga TaxID=143232 RepID=A0AAF0Y0Y7_9TREE|nr:hypothetical protein LOC62_01G001631 [Vanrija pseudolonga]